MTGKHEQRALDREAASWFARLNRPTPAPRDLESFEAWVSAPGRQAAYDRVEAIWRRSGAMAADPDIQRALGETARNRGGRRAVRPPALVWWGAGVATAGAVVLTVLIYQANFATRTFATGVGERRVVRLEDGSSIQLDTASAIKVRFTGATRDLKLVEGQALFDVAKDPDRPFRVQAGETRVDAVGTRFNVRRDGDQVRVILLQGRVNVLRAGAGDRHQWKLRPGELLAVRADRPIREIAPQAADLESAESWTQGRLVFRETSLAVAIAEINRYSREKIRLDDGVDGRTVVSGVFDTGDPTAFAGTVAALYDLRTSVRPDGEIVMTRP